MGRDTKRASDGAGRGGAIEVIAERLSPRG